MIHRKNFDYIQIFTIFVKKTNGDNSVFNQGMFHFNDVHFVGWTCFRYVGNYNREIRKT